MGKRYKYQGLSRSGSRDKQRCGAKLHGKLAACRRWPVPGKTRCRLHGGLSTGAKTPEGKARVLAALMEGRQRWIKQMKVEGKKFPWGRKSGYQWITPRMREREFGATPQASDAPARLTKSAVRAMAFKSRGKPR